MKVAIVGAGIAGLAAARALAGRHDVTIFEAEARVGGHVYTIEHDGHAIDMGFIVCNRERYPLFMRMLGELGIATRPTTMAFSVSHGGREWGSASLGALFADRRHAFASIASLRDSVEHVRFLVDVVRFLRRARRDLAAGALGDTTLADYARGAIFDRFVVPLAAALWSLAPERCGAFPAETFLRFLDQHGMLRPVGPLAWETIIGGSRRYVDALVAELLGTGTVAIQTSTPVAKLRRDARGISIGNERFDRAILATHADTALSIVDQPSALEADVLGAFTYSTNRTVLHTDRSFLPASPRAYAAWNYVADPDTSKVCVTYSMSLLQGLPEVPYLVTLNPRREPAGTIHATTFRHPQFDRAAIDAQARIPGLGAARRTYYCGAYVGFGFHEDGMRAGLAAAASAMADEARS